MTSTKLLFCHGLESGPWGRKSLRLRDEGYAVDAPDCRERDLAARLAILREAIVAARPAIVVGSSFGGIAGLLAAIEACRLGVTIEGLLLCAPALGWPPPASFEGRLECPAPTVILHGTGDDVVPVEGSRRFATEHGARLVEVDDDHRLTASLDRMVELVAELASGHG